MLTLVLFFMLGQALQAPTAYWVVFGIYVSLTALYDLVKFAKWLTER